jgi:hypothetical protein
MPKITPRPPTVPVTSENKAHTPSAPAAAASTGSAKTGWGNTPAASAAERREKATGVSTAVVELSDTDKAALVKKKGTCPFMGTAVQSGNLPVRNSAEKPLANINDIAALGNTGKGSDLGELLKVFAEGNHAFMPGMTPGKLDKPVPQGTMSLDLPGSQGSHPGHSGILEGDPKATDSGRFSDADFDRLMKYAQNGVIKRSDIGKFIAGNVAADSNAKAPSVKTAVLLAKDLGGLASQVAQTIANKATGKGDPVEDRKVFTKLTKVLGEENLVGSAGEFGLMAAFLANSPKTKQVGGEPAYSVDDLTKMFKDKQFPEGWETWKKTTADWAVNTTAIAASAEKTYAVNHLKEKFGG